MAKVTFKWPKCHFNLIFLGLGWPRVGEFVGFIIIFYMFSSRTEFGKSPTPHHLARCTRRYEPNLLSLLVTLFGFGAVETSKNPISTDGGPFTFFSAAQKKTHLGFYLPCRHLTASEGTPPKRKKTLFFCKNSFF